MLESHSRLPSTPLVHSLKPSYIRSFPPLQFFFHSLTPSYDIGQKQKLDKIHNFQSDSLSVQQGQSTKIESFLPITEVFRFLQGVEDLVLDMQEDFWVFFDIFFHVVLHEYLELT